VDNGWIRVDRSESAGVDLSVAEFCGAGSVLRGALEPGSRRNSLSP
jgi:hypothetical protein